MNVIKRAQGKNQTAPRLTREPFHHCFEVGRLVDRRLPHLPLEDRTRGLSRTREGGVEDLVRVYHDGNAPDVRGNLFEQLQPLSPERRLQAREACDISAWTGQAGDEAAGDGFADGREYDR